MNTQWENPVKKRLREGLPVVAATITVANPDVAAHAATLGFDFLWVEMEHSPITLETLRNIVLATRGLPAMTFARVPVNEIWTAKRVLDAGVSGVMFPFSSTPELAAQAAAACRYPPAGRRGSGAVLARTTWPGGEAGYQDSADENVMVIIILEEARAVGTCCSSAPAIFRSRWGCAGSRTSRNWRPPSRASWKPASVTASFWGGPQRQRRSHSDTWSADFCCSRARRIWV
jgi:hypothetical protein